MVTKVLSSLRIYELTGVTVLGCRLKLSNLSMETRRNLAMQKSFVWDFCK